jgi:hypothetical protein
MGCLSGHAGRTERLLIISVDVFVIWAVAAYGREVSV